jgi:hypothetical protein
VAVTYSGGRFRIFSSASGGVLVDRQVSIGSVVNGALLGAEGASFVSASIGSSPWVHVWDVKPEPRSTAAIAEVLRCKSVWHLEGEALVAAPLALEHCPPAR